jgi:Zn-finger nucleic acid-binding protein
MNCPVCNEKMKEIERSGVLIDLCPSCKGIWLDKGELEKLLALDAGEEAAPPKEPASAKEAEHGSVYDPVPDEMPAEFKHQDRSRFRDMAKDAAKQGGAYKPAGGRVPGQRGGTKGYGGGGKRGSVIASILESIDTGG